MEKQTKRRPVTGPGEKQGTIQRLLRFLLLSHPNRESRYWEVDAARGLAIVMMVVYHFSYDTVFLGYVRGDVFSGDWRAVASVIAGLFVIVAGVSLAISHSRASQRSGEDDLFPRYLAQGMKLFGWGLAITALTWLYLGEPGVIFGILHLIGAATILGYPYLASPRSALLAGIILIAAGAYANQLYMSDPVLFVLGVGRPPIDQRDYFPLMPWVGIMLVGIYLGKTFYPQGLRRYQTPDWSDKPVARQLIWMGQRSLAIYLVHQPLIFAFFALVEVLR